jgi:hypothetical protein
MNTALCSSAPLMADVHNLKRPFAIVKENLYLIVFLKYVGVFTMIMPVWAYI